MKKGLDLSHWNKITDWNKISADFIIHKCTESTNYFDPTYTERKKEIIKRGIRFGAYHFARGGDVRKEADWFLYNLGVIDRNDIIVLDWEINHLYPSGWIKDFLDYIKYKSGITPYLYTNENRANQIENKYPWWIARYGTNDGKQQTPPTKNWIIWQYTSRGRVAGIEGYVDLNIMKDEEPENIPEPEKFLIHPVQEVPNDPVYITQYFGENPAMYSKYGMKGHNGIDYRTRFWDSPLGHRYIVAAKDGKVIEAKWDGGYGNFIRLEHDLDGSGSEQTVYGHLKRFYVRLGENVIQGQRIGLSDNTGASTGPHLHWGYRPKGWKKIYENGYKGYIDQIKFVK